MHKIACRPKGKCADELKLTLININIIFVYVHAVDVLLPLNLEISIQNVLVLLFAIIVVCAVFPILLGIAIPCFILFLVIVGYYRRGIRDLKRIENITRSPWFSHITATVSGLATIHAYEKTNDFILR